MRRMPVVFTVLPLLLTFMCASSCMAQGRDRRIARGVPVLLGAAIVDMPAGSQVKGVLVRLVSPGGKADSAGIKAGDVIISLAGQAVASTADVIQGFENLSRDVSAGQDSEVVVLRDDKSITFWIPADTAPGTPAKGPWIGISMKDAPRQWGVEGVLASEVTAGSPADDAGIMPGDIITGINGQTVKSSGELKRAVSSLKTGLPYKISLRRSDRSIELSVTLRAIQDAQASPAKRRLSDINVLKYAIIDPQSRVVTLIGKYDPSYKTGPIQYYALLNDAIRSPYPWFSLEPTQETRNGVQKIHELIGSDVQHMSSDPSYSTAWANKLQGILLYDADVKADHARYIKKGAEAFKLNEDEMKKLLAASINPSQSSYDEQIKIVGKVLCGLGYTRLGGVLMNDDQSSATVFQGLGIGDEANAIVTKVKSGQMGMDRGKVELSVVFISAMLRELKVPDSDIKSKANRVLSGSMGEDEFQKYMMDRVMEVVVDGAGLKMFNGLALSHRVLSKLYNVPSPQMNLVFRDVPADSLLGDVLFRADYSLKTICTSPDTKENIPGFPTEMDYLYDVSVRKGTRVPGDAGAEVGHRLVPGNVKMSVSPDGTVVKFDDAQIKIIGWVMGTVGKRCTPAVADVIKTATDGYAGYLTQHYDDLSKIYPELHRLRESEKLIALARWARAGNYKIAVGKESAVRLDQSPTAIGFWQVVFTADQQEFSLMVVTEGGASFDQNEGEAWVQPSTNSQVTSDVSKQLVMSAVLSKQAANEALGGDMEAARDLADKGARAMTGDIDLTQFPKLGDIPMPNDPAKTVQLSSEAISAVDNNLRQIENAKISMKEAAKLENTSPQDAAVLRDTAKQQEQQATQNLQNIRNAMDSISVDPAKIGSATATIRNMNSWPAVASIPAPASSVPSVTSGTESPAQATVPAANNKSTKTRAELIAELDKLQKEIDKTKEQLAKLNQNIMQNQLRFKDWQAEAEGGMGKCRDILFSLFMDASAGKLAERYDTMYDLAKKLPDQPQPLIKRLGRTKELLKELGTAKTFKDFVDWAYSNGDTLPEAIDKVRDGLGLIITLKGWDKTLVGAAWNYGSNMVDMAYCYAQYLATYDALKQQTQNVDEANKALASLKGYMSKLYTQASEVKQQLADMPADGEFD